MKDLRKRKKKKKRRADAPSRKRIAQISTGLKTIRFFILNAWRKESRQKAKALRKEQLAEFQRLGDLEEKHAREMIEKVLAGNLRRFESVLAIESVFPYWKVRVGWRYRKVPSAYKRVRDYLLAQGFKVKEERYEFFTDDYQYYHRSGYNIYVWKEQKEG